MFTRGYTETVVLEENILGSGGVISGWWAKLSAHCWRYPLVIKHWKSALNKWRFLAAKIIWTRLIFCGHFYLQEGLLFVRLYTVHKLWSTGSIYPKHQRHLSFQVIGKRRMQRRRSCQWRSVKSAAVEQCLLSSFHSLARRFKVSERLNDWKIDIELLWMEEILHHLRWLKPYK